MKKKLVNLNETEYAEILNQAILQIKSSRAIIAKQINSTVNSVYWGLGRLLYEKHLEEGYGSSVVKQLSIDLKNEFPDMGLSPRNLWHMKRFYEPYFKSEEKLQRSVAVLPWRHNLLLIEKIKNDSAVEYYANEVITKGWSRDMLLNAIKLNSYEHAIKKIKSNNFNLTNIKCYYQKMN